MGSFTGRAAFLAGAMSSGALTGFVVDIMFDAPPRPSALMSFFGVTVPDPTIPTSTFVFIGGIASATLGILWTTIASWKRRRVPIVAMVSRSRRITAPPGSRVLAIADWLLPANDAERIVGQAVADMRDEHAQALAEDGRWKARWIVMRDTARIFLATGQAAWHRVGKFMLGFLKIVS